MELYSRGFPVTGPHTHLLTLGEARVRVRVRVRVRIRIRIRYVQSVTMNIRSFCRKGVEVWDQN